jgi:short-subunit dehydrogenase
MGVRGAVSRLPRFMWMDATSVAREGYDAVMAGRAVHINGLVNQGVSQVMSHLPLRLKNLIARKQAIF